MEQIYPNTKHHTTPMNLFQIDFVNHEKLIKPIQKDIIWLTTYEATLQLRHKDAVVMDIITLSSNKGITQLITDLKQRDIPNAIDRFSIDRDSTLDLAIIVSEHEVPTVNTEKSYKANQQDSNYFSSHFKWVDHIPSNWYVSDKGLEERELITAPNYYHTKLQAREVSKSIVWQFLRDSDSDTLSPELFSYLVKQAFWETGITNPNLISDEIGIALNNYDDYDDYSDCKSYSDVKLCVKDWISCYIE